MAEAVGLVASIVGIAGFAWQSSKGVYEFISDVTDAPKSLKDLQLRLVVLSSTLDTLKTGLPGREAELSEGQKACLLAAKPVLTGCQNTCDEFKAELERTMPRSQHGKRSWRDSVAFKFKEKKIGEFNEKVGAWMASLSAVLNVTTVKLTSANTETINSIREKLQTAQSMISGDMKRVGKQIADISSRLASLSLDDMKSQMDEITALKEQQVAYNDSLKLVLAASDGAQKTLGHTYLRNKAFQDATMIIGDVGDVPSTSRNNHYEGNETHDRSSVVAGHMDGAAFSALLQSQRSVQLSLNRNPAAVQQNDVRAERAQKLEYMLAGMPPASEDPPASEN